MWRWRRVAVARVFALVMRCRVMMLFVYSRVGKNRDTRRGSPAGAGAGRTADHLTVLFSQKVLAVRSANDIYRPVSGSRKLLIRSEIRKPIIAFNFLIFFWDRTQDDSIIFCCSKLWSSCFNKLPF